MSSLRVLTTRSGDRKVISPSTTDRSGKNRGKTGILIFFIFIIIIYARNQKRLHFFGTNDETRKRESSVKFSFCVRSHGVVFLFSVFSREHRLFQDILPTSNERSLKTGSLNVSRVARREISSACEFRPQTRGLLRSKQTFKLQIANSRSGRLAAFIAC